MYVNNSMTKIVVYLVNSHPCPKSLEDGVLEHLALIEVKVGLWEVEDQQNPVPDQNHLLGVSDGPSQNRQKARASLEEKRIVMTRIMYTDRPLVRSC